MALGMINARAKGSEGSRFFKALKDEEQILKNDPNRRQMYTARQGRPIWEMDHRVGERGNFCEIRAGGKKSIKALTEELSEGLKKLV